MSQLENNIQKSLSIVNIKLKYVRKKRGLSEKQLADKANLAVSAIEQFENNIRNPSTEALEKLANALDTTTEFLLGKSPNMNK